jgi:MoCo/4Fe-4S cofactor protein with predicted Tat translocation signal
MELNKNSKHSKISPGEFYQFPAVPEKKEGESRRDWLK